MELENILCWSIKLGPSFRLCWVTTFHVRKPIFYYQVRQTLTLVYFRFEYVHDTGVLALLT